MRRLSKNAGLAGAYLSLALAAAPSARAARAEEETHRRMLRMDEAIELALQQNPRCKATHKLTDAQQDQANSARGRLLPSVHASINYSYIRSFEPLNSAQLFGGFGGSTSGSGSSTPASTPSDISLWGGYASASASQPILGLLHLSEDYLAAADQADAASADLKTSNADLREAVEEGYLELFEARALEDLTRASYEDLSQQLKTSEINFSAGTLTQADVLRVRTAVANAEQQQIQAQVQGEIARAQLLTTLGLPPNDEEIDFSEPVELANRALPSSEPEALAHAYQERPELHSAHLNQSAAEHRKVARWFNLLPEVNVAASYYRLIGLPAGLPPDLLTVGFTGSWNVWAWGTDYYQAKSASEQEEAAEFSYQSSRDQVSLDVETKLAQERAAAHAVDVAQQAIASAQEAFRVTQATVNAGAATTTDLLDSQAALTQARLNLVRAKYQDLRARAQLFRAIGG